MLSAENSKVLSFLILIGMIAIFSIFLLVRNGALAEEVFVTENNNESGMPIYQETTFLPLTLFHNKDSEILKRVRVIVTGYSSSVWETQGDPFITASGTRVRDGIVANNLLPFGTKIRMPELFGDKIFVVEDRMNSRKGYYHVDIWFPSREEALSFGAKITEMEVLAN